MTDASASTPPETTEPAEIVEEESPQSPGVIHASKLMRIASMTRAMLDEVRHAPLDDGGRKRLVEVHERTIEEMEEVLTDDLREELQDIFMPLSGSDASDSEIRIAQAQLVGWLEGLFAGIQASLFSQQAAAASQLQMMRSRAIEARAGMNPQSDEEPAPGQYL
ncbi:MAG: bacterial proteasome activator family protein [Actinobacteria bacterium]|nr:bacterial proteasome activator family protein [Actinomycetota bacterium]